jgi:nucleotide-binding universal stress UspA family protein
MFKTILVCTDGSEHAIKAIQKTASLAKMADACVLLLNVKQVDQTYMPYTVPWQLEIGEVPANPEPGSEQSVILEQADQLLEKAGVRHHVLGECGHPAATIVHVAEREEADLIVLGSRGLSEWKALLLGSVSDHVTHHAPCSVLIVR